MASFPNVNLLRIIAAVAECENTGHDLFRVAGLDILDLKLFLAVACEEGYIDENNRTFRVTEKGLQYAAPVLSFMPLLDRMSGAPPKFEAKVEDDQELNVVSKALMIKPRVEVYIQHTAQGSSLRHIARARNVEPSTIKRMIDRMTDIRDMIFEWDEILTALEHRFRAEKPLMLNDNIVAETLGTNMGQVKRGLQPFQAMLSKHHAKLRMMQIGQGGIFVDDQVIGVIDRPICLTWIGIGWLETQFAMRNANADMEKPKLRTYFSTGLVVKEELPQKDEIPKVPRRRSKYNTRLSWFSLHRAMGNELMEVANRFKLVWELRDSVGYSMISKARLDMHPLLWAVLEGVVGHECGLEFFEQKHSIPARSAKVLLKVALEIVDEYDEMRQTFVAQQVAFAKQVV